ncbi:MAG TPA: type IV secretory system conjugative DNA transfer family protein [Mycobacteriales bacterium]|nr:type IV secretory system conjugative DNA transfer family protein [Mycobacteriales bacterium]
MATDRLVWRQVHWQRPLDADRCLGLLRRLASDERSPRLVLEAQGSRTGVTYLLAAPRGHAREAAQQVTALVPGTTLTPVTEARPSLDVGRQVKASTRHRALNTNELTAHVRALLSALTAVRSDERLVLQLLLGPRRIPLAVPTQSPSSVVAPWWYVVWHGNGGTIDSEKRSALRNKVGQHGFACAVRIGVAAPTPARRQQLVGGLVAALRGTETAGLQLRPVPVEAQRLVAARPPRLGWPLRLNVSEVLALTAWPLGDEDLPGQAALHPRRLPPLPGTVADSRQRRAVALSNAPGYENVELDLSAANALHHTHIVGPTGVGKSVLLGRLVGQDIAAGRAVVVIEPKGDLVDDVLAHIPAERTGDVVVLDPAEAAPVGVNPLARAASPEVTADAVLTVFRALYADSWGPRLQDILHAGLLTLARRSDASLVMLPLLLTNPGFRRSLTRGLADPLALGPFWAWYDAMGEPERAAAIAPVMNKLRPWLLNRQVRAVLGQRHPRFDLEQVFSERKVLLVPLRGGVIGREASRLIGSLLVAQLWQRIQARSRIEPARRHPVMVYIDEVQDYLHLPTDLGDALAQARGLGVGFTLAHQFLGQLRPELRTGLLANARSRVCFQLAHDDAVSMSKGHPELKPEDLTALGRYEVYASLFTDGRVTPYASGRTLPPEPASSKPALLRQASRQRYGRPLDEVERGFNELLNTEAGDEAVGRRRRTS